MISKLKYYGKMLMWSKMKMFGYPKVGFIQVKVIAIERRIRISCVCLINVLRGCTAGQRLISGPASTSSNYESYIRSIFIISWIPSHILHAHATGRVFNLALRLLVRLFKLLVASTQFCEILLARYSFFPSLSTA